MLRSEGGSETVEGNKMVLCFRGQEDGSGVEVARVYC
jgi:hypothetical protein